MNLKKNNTIQNVYLATAVLVCLIVSLMAKSAPIQIVASICGIIYVISIGFGDRTAYFFAMANALLYGTVMLLENSYANVIYNFGILFPLLIVGYFLWKKKTQICKISYSRVFIITFIAAGLSVAIAFILQLFSATDVFLDAFSAVFGTVAVLLMICRCSQQYWFWTINNLTNLSIWIIRSIKDINNLSMAVMWGIFAVNGIIAYILWEKQYKINGKKIAIKELFTWNKTENDIKEETNE